MLRGRTFSLGLPLAVDLETCVSHQGGEIYSSENRNSTFPRESIIPPTTSRNGARLGGWGVNKLAVSCSALTICFTICLFRHLSLRWNRLPNCGLNIPRHFRWRAPSVGAGNVGQIRRGLAGSGGYLVSLRPALRLRVPQEEEMVALRH